MPIQKTAALRSSIAICLSIADVAGHAERAGIMTAGFVMNWPLRTVLTWSLIAASSVTGSAIWSCSARSLAKRT